MSNRTTNESALNSLFAILAKRKQQPNDKELEAQFYDQVIIYLLSDLSDHWWCDSSVAPIARESLWFFSLPEHENIVEYKKKLSRQLQKCIHCVQEYHSSKKIVRETYYNLFSHENVEGFFNQIDAFDKQRLINALQTSDTLSTAQFVLSDELKCAISDILLAPGHLKHDVCDKLFCRLFENIQKTATFPTFGNISPDGFILLSFHHHIIVRYWARKSLEKLSLDGVTLNETSTQLTSTTLTFLFKWLSATQEKRPPFTLCEFKPTVDSGEMWKVLRCLVSIVDAPIIESVMKKEKVDMVQLLTTQLEGPASGLLGILKSMTVLFTKLQSKIWANLGSDEVSYGTLFESILKNPGFLQAIKIVHENNIGRVLLRDGSVYPQDKLAVKMKGLLEWIYPFWNSLRYTPAEANITDKVLSTLFEYFQQNGWSTMCKAYCAELGLKIMDESMVDSSQRSEKVEEYAPKLVAFLLFSAKDLPPSLSYIPEYVKEIVTKILERNVEEVRDIFVELARSENSIPYSVTLMQSITLWKAVCAQLSGNKNPQRFQLVQPVICAYSKIASIDIPRLQKADCINETKDGENALAAISGIRSACMLAILDALKQPNEDKRAIFCGPDMINPIIRLLTSAHKDIRDAITIFVFGTGKEDKNALDFRGFFGINPPKIIEGFTAYINEFNELSVTKVDVFDAVSSVVYSLSNIVNSLVGGPNSYLSQLEKSHEPLVNDEHVYIRTFWETCWRTISLIFSNGIRWAEQNTPRQVLDTIMPVLDIAHLMISSRQLFVEVVRKGQSDSVINPGMIDVEDTVLRYDHVVEAADSLSQWVYVTRRTVIDRLIPLLGIILSQLQQIDIKISLETYEKLMTAATQSNPGTQVKLDNEDKRLLLSALLPHEPGGSIFLDDSEDEELEWQLLDSPAQHVSPVISPVASTNTKSPVLPSNQRMRQMSLSDSFLSSTSMISLVDHSPQRPPPRKITSYFGTNDRKEEPIEISDDEVTPKKEPKEEPTDNVYSYQPMDIQEEGGGEEDNGDEFDFDDMDYSQIPSEWFEDEPAQPQPTPNDPSELPPVVQTASKSSSSWSFGSKLTKDPERVAAPLNSASSSRSVGQISRQQQQQQQKAQHKADLVAAVQAQRAKQHPSRFTPLAIKPQVYAVTSTGRKLRPPTMGFSRMQALKEEFKADRRLKATVKSPSASAVGQSRNKGGDNMSSSSSESSEDEGDSGLMSLVQDTKGPKVNPVEAESASVKALFERSSKRTTQLIETPSTRFFFEKREKIREAENRRKKVEPNIDRLFKMILSWDPTWQRETPPNIPMEMYRKVKNSYTSFKDYVSVFEPLLLLEAWAQLLRTRETLSECDVFEGWEFDSRCHVNDFVDVTFAVPLQCVSKMSIDELVIVANHFGPSFFRPNRDGNSTWNAKSFLGKITSITQKRAVANITLRCLFLKDRITVLNSLSPKTTWRALSLMSLTTTQREYSALQGLEQYDLLKEILGPVPAIKSVPDEQRIDHYVRNYGVNRPQAAAIAGAIDKKKGFTLIQGPPGTGKTKTILGLIVSILEERGKRSRNGEARAFGGKSKLLVCAPSNAAVDEIAKRLKDGIKTAEGILRLNVVRIGVADSVNSSVKDLVMDRLIEKELGANLEDKKTSKAWSQHRDKLNDQLRKIILDVEEVNRELADARDPVRLATLRDKRKGMITKRDSIKVMIKDAYDDQKDFTRDMDVSRIRARQKVFSQADVVCATLSGSGHDMLTSMGVTFDTVIVDEAAQSIEISTLIPLKYDCQRCVLVGDPNQLPPTVLSQTAAKYDYEQSLFMRLENNVPGDVHLLSIQYRMHPAISIIPSKLFYSSKLLDGPNMASITAAPWHIKDSFPPYQFFDIGDGQEKIGYGHSIYNPAEAEAAVALVDMLASQLPGIKFAHKIGIITPYKQQLSQLKSQFERRFGSKILDVIDFNTVDGFQGQEKDIVIFSCVRTGSSRNIGFLADVRRMNVGLTRAKSSMFILGNAYALMKSHHWRDLINDAHSRKSIRKVSRPFLGHNLTRVIPSNLFEVDRPALTKPPSKEPFAGSKNPRARSPTEPGHKIKKIRRN
ncbi:SEN1 N terminal-domain-containing protein [Phycomyces nitens]|nr:SEN1 N terminal-domain-containing protein [Phycomyces nitens]